MAAPELISSCPQGRTSLKRSLHVCFIGWGWEGAMVVVVVVVRGWGGLVFIMSHSFTRSEKAGVWESLRPFRRALPSSLMDFIEPEGEERNSVYLKAALWALKCCSVFIPPPLCLLSLLTTKTFDPPRLLCLSRHSPAIFVLHRFLDLTIFFFSQRWSSLDPSLLSWLVYGGFFRWESAPVDNVLLEMHAASGTGRIGFFFYILPSACCN